MAIVPTFTTAGAEGLTDTGEGALAGSGGQFAGSTTIGALGALSDVAGPVLFALPAILSAIAAEPSTAANNLVKLQNQIVPALQSSADPTGDWNQYLQQIQTFANSSPQNAQVVSQMFQTPSFMNSVQSALGGVNPLSDSFSTIANAQAAAAAAAPEDAAENAAAYAAQASPLDAPAATSLANPTTGFGAAVAQAQPSLGAGTAPIDTTGINAAASAANLPNTTIGDLSNLPSSLGGAPDAPAMPVGALPGTTTAGALPGAASGLGSSSLLKLLGIAGTSIAGALIGSGAASKAASTQAAASTAAAGTIGAAGSTATQTAQQILAQQQANSAPYISAGATALNQLGALTSTPYTLPTAQQAQNTPGYEFQLQQGEQALNAYEAANGTLASGGALKDITTFGQGLASTDYQNAVSNSLSAYNANINPLLSIAGLGNSATSSANSNLSTSAGLQTGITTGTAAQVANEETNAAAATASGYVGAANQDTNALGQISNALNGQLTIGQLQALLARNQSGYSGNPGSQISAAG